MDDANPTQQTFPDFKPAAPMFEGSVEKPTETPTPPATGKRKPGRPRKPASQATTAPDTPTLKTERKGKPRGKRRTMPASVTETTPAQKRTRKAVTAKRQAMISRDAFAIVKELKENEFHLTMQIADAINVLPKKARARVASALVKLVT